MEQDRPINLFIASAGLGTRLQPLTHAIAKPLLPVAGISVIDRLLHSVLATVEISDFAMNLHHLPEQFEAWAQQLEPDLPRPRIYHEKDLLGTGGAISNAQEFFRKGTCLLINGDILTDIDWGELVEHHRSSGNMVTLAVQDRSHERRVGVDAEGQLLCIDPEMKQPGVARWLGYACAAIYEPEFLEYLPNGESHVPPFWVEAAERTQRIGTFDIGPCPWLDLGNVDSYARGVFSCLNGNRRYLAEPLNIPWDAILDGTCVVEKDVTIGSGVKLSNVILLPGTRVEDGSDLASTVAGPGFQIPITFPELEAPPEAGQAILSGSDRSYRRVRDGMLLEYSVTEALIERQIALTQLLRRNGIPVPQVYSHNPSRREVLLQDLGDVSLQTWCRSRSDNEVLKMLTRVLDKLLEFQWTDTGSSPFPEDKPFDKNVLLWESSYFMERCVYRVFGLKEFCEPIADDLNCEFEILADSVAALPRMLMHRDFQSSNVMIHAGKPWFIDFQAAHHGPCFYDAASIIGDPYLSLTKEIRNQLENHYLETVIDRLGMSLVEGRHALLLCGIQRHMQALGAYGFLSSIRGKTEFLEYIAPAFQLLEEEVSSLSKEFPALSKLTGQISTVIQ